MPTDLTLEEWGVAAWLLTAFLAVLWIVLHRAERVKPPKGLDLRRDAGPPSSTLAMLHAAGYWITPGPKAVDKSTGIMDTRNGVDKKDGV